MPSYLAGKETRAWSIPEVRLGVLSPSQQSDLLLLSKAGFQEAVTALYRSIRFDDYELMLTWRPPLVIDSRNLGSMSRSAEALDIIPQCRQTR